MTRNRSATMLVEKPVKDGTSQKTGLCPEDAEIYSIRIQVTKSSHGIFSFDDLSLPELQR